MVYGLIIVSFLVYVAYMFGIPIKQRENPPQSASFLQDPNAPEYKTFPTLVSTRIGSVESEGSSHLVVLVRVVFLVAVPGPERKDSG